MYNVEEIRKQFPMLNNKTMQGKPLVYLDNASTTFKPQCVIDAICNYYENLNANSHRGDYDLCYFVDKEVLETRKAIAKFINSENNEVIFTSGDTESINLIAYGYGRKFIKKDDEIIISESEHASNAIPWMKLAEEKDAKIIFVELNEDGYVTPENLRKVITKKTKIVALASVGNVIGQDNNVSELAKISHEFGAIIAIDGAQSVPHFPIDFKSLDIDFLSFSAHKMCGPTGIGCLIGKYDLLVKMDSFITGGGMNVTFTKGLEIVNSLPPAKFEAGTLNLSGIFGFKACIEFLSSIGLENINKYEIELKEYAVSKLGSLDNVVLYNKNTKSGILTFNVKDVFAQDEATLLNSKGIAVRSGQHCAKMLNDFLKTPATCRASFYLYTTKEDIDALYNALKEGGSILDAYFND